MSEKYLRIMNCFQVLSGIANHINRDSLNRTNDRRTRCAQHDLAKQFAVVLSECSQHCIFQRKNRNNCRHQRNGFGCRVGRTAISLVAEGIDDRQGQRSKGICRHCS